MKRWDDAKAWHDLGHGVGSLSLRSRRWWGRCYELVKPGREKATIGRNWGRDWFQANESTRELVGVFVLGDRQLTGRRNQFLSTMVARVLAWSTFRVGGPTVKERGRLKKTEVHAGGWRKTGRPWPSRLEVWIHAVNTSGASIMRKAILWPLKTAMYFRRLSCLCELLKQITSPSPLHSLT